MWSSSRPRGCGPVIQLAAGVEGELKRFIAKYVKRELAKPYVSRRHDRRVAARSTRRRGLGPGRRAVADELTEDLSPALEAEILEQEQLFVDERLEAETPAAEGHNPSRLAP